MRLFLAIELPETVKKHLEEQIQSLKAEYRHFNWIPAENYHITVHFFGETVSEKAIVQRLEHVLYDIPQFHMFAFEAALFMQKRILLYIGFHREKTLEKAVDRIREEFNAQTTLKYLSHLTIGRYKIPSKQQYLLLKKKLSNLPIELEFPVEKLVLYESIAGRNNPVYKKHHEFPLLHK